MPKGIPKNGINKGWIKKGQLLANHRGTSEMRNCKFCYKIFKVSTHNIKRGKGKFCSLGCVSKDRSKNKENYGGFCKGHPNYITPEGRIRQSLSLRGDKSPFWKGGISKDLSAYSRKRRDRELGAEGSHTTKQWERLKSEYKYLCACCKKVEPEIKLTEDHIIPLSKGGSDYIWNIQPLCRSCNSRKHTKTKSYSEVGQTINFGYFTDEQWRQLKNSLKN